MIALILPALSMLDEGGTVTEFLHGSFCTELLNDSSSYYQRRNVNLVEI